MDNETTAAPAMAHASPEIAAFIDPSGALQSAGILKVDAPTARPCAVWSGPMDTLRALLTVAGERDVRFYLNGVCLDTTGPEPVMVATDGCRMLMVRAPRLVSTLPRGCYVIPRAMLEAVKPVKLGRGQGDAPVTLTVLAPIAGADTGRAELVGATTASAPLVDGRFPDWRRVVPSKLTGKPCQYNTDYLADFGTVARLLVSAKRGEMVFPTFAHNGDIGGRKGDHGAALVTFPRSPDAFGVLMPMRTDSPPTVAPHWAGCWTD